MPDFRSTEADGSYNLYQRALKTAPGGVHSHFRMNAERVPLFIRRAKGAYMFDHDGRTYIDYALGQGPNILGHAHPAIVAAVKSSVEEGLIYAAQHRREIQLAEHICELVPCADMVRLGCTGSEVVHAALRLARAVTGRRLIVRFEGHYHGWLDNIAVGIGPGQGLSPWSRGQYPPSSDEVAILPWNDSDALAALFSQRGEEIAGVIMEPVMCNSGCIEPLPDYLESVRNLCTRHGAVLIFDEVITGFRLHPGGAQGYLGVTPDLATFGKAVAGGLPLSVLAGRREVMEELGHGGGVIQAGTLNSCVPATAAALAALEVLADEQTHQHLFAMGQRLKEGLASLAGSGNSLTVTGPGPVIHAGFAGGDGDVTNAAEFHERYDSDQYARFANAMMDSGVNLIKRGIWFVSLVHTGEDIDSTVETASSMLQHHMRKS